MARQAAALGASVDACLIPCSGGGLAAGVVVEPGGAVALAAALSGRLDCRGETVAIVLSGGTVDPRTFALALGRL